MLVGGLCLGTLVAITSIPVHELCRDEVARTMSIGGAGPQLCAWCWAADSEDHMYTML
jgi:hypothetical protein